MDLMPLLDWIKKNKLAAFLLLVIGIYLGKSIINTFFGIQISSLNIPRSFEKSSSSYTALGAPDRGIFSPPPYTPTQDYTPQPEIKDRLVIQESKLSLLVEDVTDIREKIVKYAQDKGGYMVSSNISNPQDAPTAIVVVRIPAAHLEDALNYFRSLSIKVVSENLVGKDVTDQYVDIDTRIAQLERSKTRLEEILSQATQINDITNLTQQILNFQNQIDSLKGQQDALAKNAQLAKLTIYLSTDEIALPYAPSETFRPNVIFKLAVRSLISNLRKLATLAIWVGVYSVIWIPALGIYIWIRRLLKERKKTEIKIST